MDDIEFRTVPDQEFQRIGLIERKRIPRLRMRVHADNPKSGLPISNRSSARATEQIEQPQHAYPMTRARQLGTALAICSHDG